MDLPPAAEAFPQPFLLPSAGAPEQPRGPHVLLVLDQFPRSLGGGERIVLRLASLLPQYGFRVSILTFAIAPESAVLRETIPCPVYLLPLQRTYDARAMHAAFRLGRFLQQQDVRIVQTFFESSDLWAGAVTRALSSARLIWSRRDMGILRARKHEVAYRWMAHLPDRVFAVSEQVRQHVITVDGVPPERVLTVYNGLDLSQWKSTRTAPGTSAPVITTVGNIRAVKGHDVLAQAAALVLVQHPEAQFTVAGEVLEPDFFAQLQQLVRQLGIAQNFRFTGSCRDLPAHLAAASVFVLPSRSEGFSNAIIEAMAAGLPVVATDVGGNAEAVRQETAGSNGATGIIVPPEDPARLAEALLRLLDGPSLARRMGEAGRRHTEENFTTAAMMEHVTRTYRDVLRS